MVGKYEIEVYNNSAHYFLTVKRNITIIQGFSATGKTELIRLIGEYERYGDSSGVTVKCDIDCHVIYGGSNWELEIGLIQGGIIFIDENASFVKSKRFAEVVRESDNYYVIVTRDDLPELPYSVEEIYGLRDDFDKQKYKTFHKVYNEMYKIYNLELNDSDFEKVITEDSNSGYALFSYIYGDKCFSSGGKSKVYTSIINEQQPMLVIVDGAAFGSEMSKIMRYIKYKNVKCILYAPESFEFIILSSDIVDVDKTVLEETYNYAESSEYMSWEQFYTDYLIHCAEGTVYKYSKKKLNPAYLTEGVLKKIKSQMPAKIL